MALTQTQVSQLYVAIFNRASEGSGNTFWQAQADAATAATAMLATSDAETYFGDSLDSDQAFVEHIYLNTLNKTIEDDPEGIAYWVGKLAQPGGESRGAVVAGLVEAIESYGPDGENYDPEDTATVASYNQFTNRVEVSNYMASEVTNPPVNYAQSTAFDKDLVVTDDATTVTSAKAAVDVLAEEENVVPPVEGETFLLTADTDRLDGTANDDFFDAPITQNPWAGGVSNSLSTADRLDGAAGTDTLYAELVPEFFGVTGDNQMDLQPRIASVEDIKFEAMDYGTPTVGTGDANVYVDAKNITDVVKIGSSFSDGNLVIENLTTLTAAGVARNTDSITVTMDHTDNLNHDGHASNLDVYFDEDYLLSGESVQSKAIYYLLDQDADLFDTDVDGDGVVDLLAKIDKNGLIFTVDGGAEQIIEFDQTLLTDGSILNHDDFVAALQPALAALIAAGTVPADTTLYVDTTLTRTTFLDDGSVSSLIPAIVIESQSTTGLESVGFVEATGLIGDFNVFGRLFDDDGTENNPVAINVELHKVGRDNDGGDLFIGGKHDEGIPDFYVSVLGADDKPSSLGTITTNTNDLENVFISTHSDFLNGDSFASLEVRNGFVGQASVDLVDADEFLGDLILGSDTPVNDLIILEARGGGDVTFVGLVDGTTAGVDDVLANDGRDYSYSTGAGDDTFLVTLDGDAVDTGSNGMVAGIPAILPESFTINTGSGDDAVSIISAGGVSQQTMFILDNLSIDTGSGADRVTINGYERFDIKTQAGDDYVEITSVNPADGFSGAWAFGAPTGVQPFVDRALYHAELTVNFAGFESTVAVETDAAGNFVADQLAINKAIMRAIDDSTVLSELLDYNPGTGDQYLVITSDFDGANELSIDLFQPTLVAADAVAGEVVLSSGDVTAIRQGIINTTALDSADLEDAAEIIAEFNNGANANLGDGSLGQTGNDISAAQFDYQFQLANADATADATIEENYSVINTSAGNDIVVLHSNDVSANTLVFDAEFDHLTVVNFFDDAARTVTGNHIFDFTAYLNNQQDPSDAPAGNAQSVVTIPVTYDGPETAAAGDDLVGNEFTVLKPDFDTDDTFAGLTASNFLSAINGDDATTDFADIDDNSLDAADSPFGDNFVGTVQDHIVFVENDANRGEYKVFHLTSELDANGDVDNDDGDFANAFLLGTVDFGATITGDPISEANLWGSANPTGDGVTSWSNFYLNDVITGEDVVVVPNTPPVAGDNLNAFTVEQGEDIVISAATLLANDSDADGDALTIVAVDDDGTVDGTVVLSADGVTITFTAAADYEGAAGFEYTLSDGTATDTAAVTGAVTVAGAATTVDIAYGETGVVAATAATEIFDFDVVTALADAGALVTQASITGFDTAADSLLLDIATATGATTLDQLVGVDGITAQADPFAGNMVISFGSDANGGELVTLTLVGVTDATLVDVVGV